jgi:hypothetical protein
MLFKRDNKDKPGVRVARPYSKPASVFSYYSSRSRTGAGTGRHDFTDRPSRLRHLPTLLAGLVVIFSLFYALSLGDNPRVVLLARQTPNILRSNEVYQQAAHILLAESLFNSTKITVNTNEIAQRLRQQFPELEAVSVNIPIIGRRPVIQIAPANPAVILTNQTEAYVLDRNGRALVKVSDVPAVIQLNLPQIIDDAGIDILPGEVSLPKDTVRFVIAVNGQLTAKELKIQSVSLPAVVNELHVRIKGDSYFAKLNLQEEVRLQVGTFLAVRDRLIKEGGLPLEYIDVRVEGRAYYK